MCTLGVYTKVSYNEFLVTSQYSKLQNSKLRLN